MTTDEVPSVHVRSLGEAGLLGNRPRQGTWTWLVARVGTVTARYQSSRERLLVATGGEAHWEEVPIAWVPCPLGGHRPWLTCPRCGRRCEAVYLHDGTACRACHGLAYRSQRLGLADRAHLRGMRLMARLGLAGEAAHWAALEPWSARRPPGMHRATHARILTSALVAERERLEALSYLGSGQAA